MSRFQIDFFSKLPNLVVGNIYGMFYTFGIATTIYRFITTLASLRGASTKRLWTDEQVPPQLQRFTYISWNFALYGPCPPYTRFILATKYMYTITMKMRRRGTQRKIHVGRRRHSCPFGSMAPNREWGSQEAFVFSGRCEERERGKIGEAVSWSVFLDCITTFGMLLHDGANNAAQFGSAYGRCSPRHRERGVLFAYYHIHGKAQKVNVRGEREREEFCCFH